MGIIEDISFGLFLGIAAAISPGALLALLISETLRGNIKNGILVSVSPIVTDLPILFVSIYILKKIENFTSLVGIISATGGVLLFYLGIKNIFAKHSEISTDMHGSFVKGVVINILNPYTYLFWFFIGAPYISDKGFVNSAAFVISFFIGITGSMILIAFFVEKIKRFIESRYYDYLLKFIGFLFIIFGVLLIKNSMKYLGL
ncbi:LysE family translocator [Persephonella marina]|nr:LysE family transporter [Persephonella marina]